MSWSLVMYFTHKVYKQQEIHDVRKNVMASQTGGDETVRPASEEWYLFY